MLLRAFLVLMIAPVLGALELPMAKLRVVCPVAEPRVERAIEAFDARVRALGGAALVRGDAASEVALHVFLLDGGANAPEETPAWFAGLTPWQQTEAFVLAPSGSGAGLELYGGGFMGLVYGLSELTVRLRLQGREPVLSFPEWAPGQTAAPLMEAPAVEGRGEYLNVGYDIAGITPHQWDRVRWRAYIDRLVLAKLNRFYYYLWVDSYTIFPSSALSALPLSRKLHEDMQAAIAYAQSRGLDVTCMISPTFLPRDVWEQHPEMHAEIEYVDHGFPVACPRAPGAVALMEAVWRSELEYSRKADAVQIWFYDPGGCWCEQNGCRTHQAESLADQFTRFGHLARELNPKVRLEFNVWPAWIWEERMGQRYRAETARQIAGAFSGGPERITAVGAPDSESSLPLIEQAAGFRTGAFLFATNPESGYSFTIPHVRYTRESIRIAQSHGVQDLFGHRLEAWTRYPETFVQGEWLWNPERTPEVVFQRLGAWMTADDKAGEAVARGFALLDGFLEDGATPAGGAEIAAAAHEAFRLTPASQRAEMQAWLEMCLAVEVLGRAADEEDAGRLEGLRAEFERLLRDSTVFAPIGALEAPYFERYRKLLKAAWRTGVY